MRRDTGGFALVELPAVSKWKRNAFTLVELLVVIGIIALLIAILLPALAKSRWQATMVSCASNERQLGMVFLMYAHENKGSLPRFDLPSGAGEMNLSDLQGGTTGFYATLNSKYKLPQMTCFCPAGNTDRYDAIFNTFNTGVNPEQAISYSIWVPHQSDGAIVPPVYFTDPPPTGPPMGFDTNPPIHAPIKLGEKIGLTNPILTDSVYLWTSGSFQVANPKTVNFLQLPQPYYQGDYGGHYQRDKLDSINCCYVDGHVDRHFAKEIQVRYKSLNAWVCR
jgi:prepilin-type N-terminal cleavage/methylation domain-containing protein/prepilin-type processing-associated H-X9-DG protein